jgi:hypothetical protein
LDHVGVNYTSAVVDQVAAHQHGEHENSDIIVCFFFKITEALSVNEKNIYYFAVLCFDWHYLIPKPKTLCAGCGLVSNAECIRLSNQRVENVRFASTVLTSD